MKKYNVFEAILFAILIILSYIWVLSRAEFIFILLILFSIILTVLIVKSNSILTKTIVKLFVVWLFVISICFFKMPSFCLSFIALGIGICGLITNIRKT